MDEQGLGTDIENIPNFQDSSLLSFLAPILFWRGESLVDKLQFTPIRHLLNHIRVPDCVKTKLTDYDHFLLADRFLSMSVLEEIYHSWLPPLPKKH